MGDEDKEEDRSGRISNNEGEWMALLRGRPTWKRGFKLPWCGAVPPNHLDDKMDPDQEVVNKELSLSPPDATRSHGGGSWAGYPRGSGFRVQGFGFRV